MRRNRLLLPWGLLAGLLILFATVEGLNIKPPSLRTKSRNAPTTTKATPLTTASTTTTSTTTTEAPETTTEQVKDNETTSEANSTRSLYVGIPQIDYVHDPNLPRELPKGYNLSEYPFFERVPENVEYECDGKLDGFYANVQYKCQIYHHCVSGLRYDFLCANYTAFDQRTFICQFVSEVDCVNTAKWWFRNEPLYKGSTTSSTTTTTTTAAPTTSTRRPAGNGKRRRRPFRRRRPQYDYYDEEDYEDEDYEDDLEAPGQNGNRKRTRPTPATIAASDAEMPPLKPIGASVYRPRVLPKVRRPVPINEREKYDYKKKQDGGTATAGGEKRPSDSPDKLGAAPAGVPEKEPEKTKRPGDNTAPALASQADKPRAHKARPKTEDEYYDDEDYDVPVRTSSRKNNHDYYAPSGGDRDFTRRPVMTGAGRPLRRNRPGRRRPAVLEYDDDYEDVRRPYRPSAAAQDDRRRPTKTRKRPYQRDDYYDDEDEYERPSYRDTKRPQSSRVAYERTSSTRDSVYDRAPPSRDTVPRTPSRNTAALERPAPSSADTAYDRPATPSRDAAYERPEASTRNRDSTYERPAAPSRDSTYERPATPTRDLSNERQPPARDTRPVANNRDVGYERSPIPSREATYDRAPPPPARDVDYDRDLPAEQPEYNSRTSSKDYDRSAASKKRVQTTSRETSNVRPRQETPASRGNANYDRPLSSRPRPSDLEEQPIPAARPAYISTTGRTSSFRRRGPEEPVTASGFRGIPRPTPKVTEPPPLDDEEYYDDEEEELEEELPQKPTGSGRVQTGSYKDTPVESRKPTGSRVEAEEPRSIAARVKGEEGDDKIVDERDRMRVPAKDRERVAPFPPTSRGRLSPGADDLRSRARPSYDNEEHSETRSDDHGNGSKTPTSHEQIRSNPNRETESIIEQPPLRTNQGRQRTEEESLEDSVPQQHQSYRPAEVTTDRYSNFRRKQTSGATSETKQVPPPRDDRVVEIAEDVHIAPSSQGRSQTTGEAQEANHSQMDVELEGETSPEDHSKQLDTSKFISSSELEEKKPIPASGPSETGFNYKNPPKSEEEDEPIPTGRGASRTPELLEDTPHRNELPDINDPEYDVTLNEALQPTRPILLSTEGAVAKKKPILGYPYRDVSLQPDKLQQSLLTSASQTHVSKAPLPHRPTPQYDDYDDPPIPTGKGGTTPVYSTTESVFRGSSIALSSRGASGQQFPGSKGSTQYVQFSTSPATGSLRHLEQELSKTLPRSRVNPLPYRSPAQGTIREADYYRGTIDPIALSLGYEYDQAAKYRPRRKLVWRDRFHDFYNLY